MSMKRMPVLEPGVLISRLEMERQEFQGKERWCCCKEKRRWDGKAKRKMMCRNPLQTRTRERERKSVTSWTESYTPGSRERERPTRSMVTAIKTLQSPSPSVSFQFYFKPEERDFFTRLYFHLTDGKEKWGWGGGRIHLLLHSSNFSSLLERQSNPQHVRLLASSSFLVWRRGGQMIIMLVLVFREVLRGCWN